MGALRLVLWGAPLRNETACLFRPTQPLQGTQLSRFASPLGAERSHVSCSDMSVKQW